MLGGDDNGVELVVLYHGWMCKKAVHQLAYLASVGLLSQEVT